MRAPGRPREHVLSRSVRTRALAAAASCLILSTSLLEQPDTVEAAPAVAPASDTYAGAPLAFLGLLGPPGALAPAFPVAPSARAGERPASRASARRHVERRQLERRHVERRQLERRPAVRRHVERVAGRRAPAARPTSTRATRRTVAHKVARAVGRRAPAARSGLAAVAAWARGHIGGRYVPGGTGRGGYDCSGFTRAAYRAAGIRLPRTSGAQASRTKSVSRREARPGDLVIGPGHVGIYAGGGMMWDAGNSRVGVTYRRMYRGLRIGRVR